MTTPAVLSAAAFLLAPDSVQTTTAGAALPAGQPVAPDGIDEVKLQGSCIQVGQSLNN